MAINLLPKEIESQNKQQRAGQSVKYVTYALFVVSAVIMVGGALLVYSQQQKVNDLKKQQQDLITEVGAYQQQEHQLIAIKDRLGTAEVVLSSRNLEGVRDLHKLLYDLMPPGVLVTQQNISDRDNSYTIQSNSSMTLRSFIRTIKQEAEFTEVIMNQLSYNPTTGYQVQFAVK